MAYPSVDSSPVLIAQQLDAKIKEERAFDARVEIARYVREKADGDIEVRRLLNDILGLPGVPERSCPVPQEDG